MLPRPPVRSKREMVPLYTRGCFGNHSPTWLDPYLFQQEAPRGSLYHLRNGAVAGGVTYYKQRQEEAFCRWTKQPRLEDWYCSMQVPYAVEQSLLLQGEVFRDTFGLRLFYSTVKKPMRDALVEYSRDVSGIMARLLIAEAMDPSSYDDLQTLLDEYDGHIVEFSSYSVCWGTVPNRNTIFWEVRSGY